MPSTLRPRILDTARGYIGTTFHHGAAVRGVGCDCAGLLIAVARDLELLPKDFDADTLIGAYSRDASSGRMLTILRQFLREVEPAAAQPGDVLCFRIRTDPQHLAFLGEQNSAATMIHAYEGLGFVAENRLDEAWAGRLVAAFVLLNVRGNYPKPQGLISWLP